MAVRTEQFAVATAGETDVRDITAQVQDLVDDAGISSGQALASVRGSTAAIATMEFEPCGDHDLRRTIVVSSEAVLVVDGRLALGTWQQLVLIDFGERPRKRTVAVQITG